MNTENCTLEKEIQIGANGLLRRYEKGERNYSLFCAGENALDFRIEIRDGEERESGSIRCSFLAAVDLFEKIANSDTPPYVLPEILADFVVEKG